MKILIIAYDNGSYIGWFPHGLAYIAGSLLKNNYEVEVYQQDIYHYKPEHLTDLLNKGNYDVVMLGVIAGYYQYKKLLEISNAIKNSDCDPWYILGGHGPNPEPEYFLRKTGADFIVMGEGELTIIDLLKNVNEYDRYKTIKGISYIDKNDIFVQTEPAPVLEDIDSFLPAWELFDINYYALGRSPGMGSTDRMMPVISGRGCPYKCNFCYRLVKGYRPRAIKSVVNEIEILQDRYNINAIDFSDELLMVSKNRTIEMCEALQGLGIKWSCNGRLNIVDREILGYMKRAGCVFINYGIECLDDEVLRVMSKNLTCKQIIDGVEATNEVGIIPGLNVIFGNIDEDERTLQNGVDFLLKYNKGGQLRTIRPVTPYPGSPLYYYAIEKGLLEGPEDFYERKHVNSDLLAVNFTKLSDERFYQVLSKANVQLVNDYYSKNRDICIKQAIDLYENKNDKFRGFRQI